MARDFPSKQVKPENVTDNFYAPDESGTPVTGFSEAPLVPQDRGGPGPGVPGSNRKIH